MIERKTIEKIMSIAIKVLFSALFVLIFLSYANLEATKKPRQKIDLLLNEQQANMLALLSGKTPTVQGKEVITWPPKMNHPYPDLELIDKRGSLFNLSDLKGYILVISYVDMSSPTSQAQAGAAFKGSYGITKEKDIDKHTQIFSNIVRKNALDEFKLPSDKVIELYVLIYAQDGAQPSVDDAENWATHFNLNLPRGIVVAVPKDDMRNTKTQSLLTGYQLIDQHMMLRVDSTGRAPKHNLDMTLVPLLSKLAE